MPPLQCACGKPATLRDKSGNWYCEDCMALLDPDLETIRISKKSIDALLKKEREKQADQED